MIHKNKIILTPELLAEMCKRNLSKEEIGFVIDTCFKFPDLAAASCRVLLSGLNSESEVANTMLEACRFARKGGSS